MDLQRLKARTSLLQERTALDAIAAMMARYGITPERLNEHLTDKSLLTDSQKLQNTRTRIRLGNNTMESLAKGRQGSTPPEPPQEKLATPRAPVVLNLGE